VAGFVIRPPTVEFVKVTNSLCLARARQLTHAGVAGSIIVIRGSDDFLL
jgi:hypothetical protein